MRSTSGSQQSAWTYPVPGMGITTAKTVDTTGGTKARSSAPRGFRVLLNDLAVNLRWSVPTAQGVPVLSGYVVQIGKPTPQGTAWGTKRTVSRSTSSTTSYTVVRPHPQPAPTGSG